MSIPWGHRVVPTDKVAEGPLNSARKSIRGSGYLRVAREHGPIRVLVMARVRQNDECSLINSVISNQERRGTSPPRGGVEQGLSKLWVLVNYEP